MKEDITAPMTIDDYRQLLDGGITTITVLDTGFVVVSQFNAEQTPFACAINRAFCDRFSPETADLIREALQQALDSRESQTAETQHDGNQAYRHVVKMLSFNQTDPVIAVYSTDITREKHYAADARRFRTIFDNSIDGITINRSDRQLGKTIVIETNAAVTRITGYTPEEIPHVPREKLYPADEYNAVIRRRIAGDQDLVERRFIHKNGTLGWIQSMGVKSQEGEVVEWIVLVRDISEQKHLEFELQQASQRFKSLADSLPASVTWVDMDENYLYVNQHAARSLGRSQDEFVGLKITDVMKTAQTVQKWRDQLANVIETRNTVMAEYTVDHNGTTFHQMVTIVPQFDENGSITSTILQSVDLTEIFRREEALRKAKLEAEQATKVKDRFIANISHELRTPLNVILGFTDLLRTDENVDSAAHEYIDLIIGNGRHLARLVDDMLNASQLDLANFYLNIAAVNLHHLIQHIVRSQTERMKAKGLAFSADIAPDVPVWIQTDDIRLRQIINNLVDNAFKYSQRGLVEIHVTCNDDLKNLHIEVLDQGDGIPEPLLAQIFEAFVTLGDPNTNGSIGLGLYITRSLVHLMGGTINARNRAEGGSIFLIDLPLRASSLDDIAHILAKGEPVRLANRAEKYRIAIIEDIVANAVLLEKQLVKWGFIVDPILDSRHALERMRQQRPDLILLDLYMPGLDGFTLIRLIRKEDALHRIPIIAVTATGITREHKRAVVSGCNDFLLKPIKHDLLAKKLEDLLGVEFIYRPKSDPAIFAEVNSTFEMLTRHELQGIPSDWLTRMYAATVTASIDSIRILITEIEGEHPAAADKMRHLLFTFNHSQIADLLEDMLGEA